jgi:hypothetical protein
MRYSSPSHFARSTSRQRSEQNGNARFACRGATGFSQMGQVLATGRI